MNGSEGIAQCARVCCCRRPPHANSRRRFRRAAHRATSVAHATWSIHRVAVLLLGTGQQDIPSVFQQSNLPFIPAFLPLVLLVCWVFRVRFANACKIYSTKPMPPVPLPGIQTSKAFRSRPRDGRIERNLKFRNRRTRFLPQGKPFATQGKRRAAAREAGNVGNFRNDWRIS